MKLVNSCPNCNKEIKIPSFWIGDRIDLAKSKGAEFSQTCKHCYKQFNAHVDDIKAVEDKTVPIIGILTFIPAVALTYILWNYGFVAYASIALPIIATTSARHNQRTKINQFNLLYYDSKRRRA